MHNTKPVSHHTITKSAMPTTNRHHINHHPT